MWKNVKFIQLPLLAIIIIAVLIVLFVALFIVFKKHGSGIVYWINDKIIYRKTSKDSVVRVDKLNKF